MNTWDRPFKQPSRFPTLLQTAHVGLSELWTVFPLFSVCPPFQTSTLHCNRSFLPLLVTTMSLPLPPELVREIIYFTLSSAPEILGCSTKPSWLTLNALSLTSRTYRALVLEAWFCTLYVESPKDLDFVRYCWPEVGAKWTRHLHCI